MEKKQKKLYVFWAFVFVGVFLVLSQRGYSDGDDAFFYQYTHEMGFLQYLSWRYETWVGRMSAEALVYFTFHLGLWFWRVVNAAMLILIPIGLITLAETIAKVPQEQQHSLKIAVMATSGYLLMGAMTIGYAAVWVNGSIFYTWTFACGIWALVPVAKTVFGHCRWQMFLCGIPCALVAAMSIEQMGAVLLAFEMLAVLYCLIKQRRANGWLLAQTIITLLAFFVLFAAPGNDVRVAAEIVNWMPEYEVLSFGEHLFITVQWLLSSLANENKWFFVCIWIAGIILLCQENTKKICDRIFVSIAGVFISAVVLGFFGIEWFSDMGMYLSDITVCIQTVPKAANLSALNITALIWWTAAMLFTAVFLWRTTQLNTIKSMRYVCTILLIYLAGIASEAIMFFSPTMYASGARVYYLTDLLYVLLLLCLAFQMEEKRRGQFCAIVGSIGILNFLTQIPTFLAQIENIKF